jgi:hypothetical protein
LREYNEYGVEVKLVSVFAIHVEVVVVVMGDEDKDDDDRSEFVIIVGCNICDL